MKPATREGTAQGVHAHVVHALVSTCEFIQPVLKAPSLLSLIVAASLSNGPCCNAVCSADDSVAEAEQSWLTVNFTGLPYIVLHVPSKLVARKAVQEVDKWEVVPKVRLKVVQLWIGIMDILLIKKEEHRPERQWQAAPKFLRCVVCSNQPLR